MFWGILNAALWLLNTFLYKRAVELSVREGFSAAYRTLAMNANVFVLVFACIVPWVWIEVFPSPFPTKDIALFFLISGFSTLHGFAGQYAYANEKVSVLAPFGQLPGMLVIIFWFILFSGGSILSFAAALVASITLILSSINFRSFTVSKYSLILAGGGLFGSASSLMMVSLVAKYSSFSIITIQSIFELLFSFLIAFLLKEIILPVRSHFRGPHLAFALNNIVWLITFAIGLYLIRDLGIVFASLLGMLSLVATMGLAWWIEKKPPERKNLYTAIVVSLCVLIAGIGG